MRETERNDLTHSVTLKAREYMQISGVTDVESFDEETVKLITTDGALTVNGTKLHISQLQLETGDVRLDGKVNSVTYTDHQPHRSLWGRLFR